MSIKANRGISQPDHLLPSGCPCNRIRLKKMHLFPVGRFRMNRSKSFWTAMKMLKVRTECNQVTLATSSKTCCLPSHQPTNQASKPPTNQPTRQESSRQAGNSKIPRHPLTMAAIVSPLNIRCLNLTTNFYLQSPD